MCRPQFQKCNHFPGTWELGRKDRLYKNLAKMRRLRGAAFDLTPRFFCLPQASAPAGWLPGCLLVGPLLAAVRLCSLRAGRCVPLPFRVAASLHGG